MLNTLLPGPPTPTWLLLTSALKSSHGFVNLFLPNKPVFGKDGELARGDRGGRERVSNKRVSRRYIQFRARLGRAFVIPGSKVIL